MLSQFPLFQSHLDLAHTLWKKVILPGDIVIDATCGNGNDTLVLAKILEQGTLYAIDIQKKALEIAKQKLETENHIRWIHACHSKFPQEITHAKLIVYNLGYLPGGRKEVTTQTETTLMSIQNGLKLLVDGGCMSITCYPGHPEGAKEEENILAFASQLDPKTWSCCHHRWINRNQSPSLLWIQKANSSKGTPMLSRDSA